MHHPVGSNVRGARGCKGSGVPSIRGFLGDCHVFASNRDPTPLSSPRPVRISSARLFVGEHGARGPDAVSFVQGNLRVARRNFELLIVVPRSQRRLAPLARNRRSPRTSPRPAGRCSTHSDRTSAGRGDARGVGYRGSADFSGIAMFSRAIATPLPFITSPRADQFRGVVRRGARGEGTSRAVVCARALCSLCLCGDLRRHWRTPPI